MTIQVKSGSFASGTSGNSRADESDGSKSFGENRRSFKNKRSANNDRHNLPQLINNIINNNKTTPSPLLTNAKFSNSNTTPASSEASSTLFSGRHDQYLFINNLLRLFHKSMPAVCIKYLTLQAAMDLKMVNAPISPEKTRLLNMLCAINPIVSFYNALLSTEGLFKEVSSTLLRSLAVSQEKRNELSENLAQLNQLINKIVQLLNDQTTTPNKGLLARVKRSPPDEQENIMVEFESIKARCLLSLFQHIVYDSPEITLFMRGFIKARDKFFMESESQHRKISKTEIVSSMKRNYVSSNWYELGKTAFESNRVMHDETGIRRQLQQQIIDMFVGITLPEGIDMVLLNDGTLSVLEAKTDIDPMTQRSLLKNFIVYGLPSTTTRVIEWVSNNFGLNLGYCVGAVVLGSVASALGQFDQLAVNTAQAAFTGAGLGLFRNNYNALVYAMQQFISIEFLLSTNEGALRSDLSPVNDVDIYNIESKEDTMRKAYVNDGTLPERLSLVNKPLRYRERSLSYQYLLSALKPLFGDFFQYAYDNYAFNGGNIELFRARYQASDLTSILYQMVVEYIDDFSFDSNKNQLSKMLSITDMNHVTGLTIASTNSDNSLLQTHTVTFVDIGNVYAKKNYEIEITSPDKFKEEFMHYAENTLIPEVMTFYEHLGSIYSFSIKPSNSNFAISFTINPYRVANMVRPLPGSAMLLGDYVKPFAEYPALEKKRIREQIQEYKKYKALRNKWDSLSISPDEQQDLLERMEDFLPETNSVGTVHIMDSMTSTLEECIIAFQAYDKRYLPLEIKLLANFIDTALGPFIAANEISELDGSIVQPDSVQLSLSKRLRAVASSSADAVNVDMAVDEMTPTDSETQTIFDVRAHTAFFKEVAASVYLKKLTLKQEQMGRFLLKKVASNLRLRINAYLDKIFDNRIAKINREHLMKYAVLDYATSERAFSMELLVKKLEASAIKVTGSIPKKLDLAAYASFSLELQVMGLLNQNPEIDYDTVIQILDICGSPKLGPNGLEFAHAAVLYQGLNNFEQQLISRETLLAAMEYEQEEGAGKDYIKDTAYFMGLISSANSVIARPSSDNIEALFSEGGQYSASAKYKKEKHDLDTILLESFNPSPQAPDVVFLTLAAAEQRLSANKDLICGFKLLTSKNEVVSFGRSNVQLEGQQVTDYWMRAETGDKTIFFESADDLFEAIEKAADVKNQAAMPYIFSMLDISLPLQRNLLLRDTLDLFDSYGSKNNLQMLKLFDSPRMRSLRPKSIVGEFIAKNAMFKLSQDLGIDQAKTSGSSAVTSPILSAAVGDNTYTIRQPQDSNKLTTYSRNSGQLSEQFTHSEQRSSDVVPPNPDGGAKAENMELVSNIDAKTFRTLVDHKTQSQISADGQAAVAEVATSADVNPAEDTREFTLFYEESGVADLMSECIQLSSQSMAELKKGEHDGKLTLIADESVSEIEAQESGKQEKWIDFDHLDVKQDSADISVIKEDGSVARYNTKDQEILSHLAKYKHDYRNLNSKFKRKMGWLNAKFKPVGKVATIFNLSTFSILLAKDPSGSFMFNTVGQALNSVGNIFDIAEIALSARYYVGSVKTPSALMRFGTKFIGHTGNLLGGYGYAMGMVQSIDMLINQPEFRTNAGLNLAASSIGLLSLGVSAVSGPVGAFLQAVALMLYIISEGIFSNTLQQKRVDSELKKLWSKWSQANSYSEEWLDQHKKFVIKKSGSTLNLVTSQLGSIAYFDLDSGKVTLDSPLISRNNEIEKFEVAVDPESGKNVIICPFFNRHRSTGPLKQVRGTQHSFNKDGIKNIILTNFGRAVKAYVVSYLEERSSENKMRLFRCPNPVPTSQFWKNRNGAQLPTQMGENYACVDAEGTKCGPCMPHRRMFCNTPLYKIYTPQYTLYGEDQLCREQIFNLKSQTKTVFHHIHSAITPVSYGEIIDSVLNVTEDKFRQIREEASEWVEINRIPDYKKNIIKAGYEFNAYYTIRAQLEKDLRELSPRDYKKWRRKSYYVDYDKFNKMLLSVKDLKINPLAGHGPFRGKKNRKILTKINDVFWEAENGRNSFQKNINNLMIKIVTLKHRLMHERFVLTDKQVVILLNNSEGDFQFVENITIKVEEQKITNSNSDEIIPSVLRIAVNELGTISKKNDRKRRIATFKVGKSETNLSLINEKTIVIIKSKFTEIKISDNAESVSLLNVFSDRDTTKMQLYSMIVEQVVKLTSPKELLKKLCELEPEARYVKIETISQEDYHLMYDLENDRLVLMNYDSYQQSNCCHVSYTKHHQWIAEKLRSSQDPEIVKLRDDLKRMQDDYRKFENFGKTPIIRKVPLELIEVLPDRAYDWFISYVELLIKQDSFWTRDNHVDPKWINDIAPYVIAMTQNESDNRLIKKKHLAFNTANVSFTEVKYPSFTYADTLYLFYDLNQKVFFWYDAKNYFLILADRRGRIFGLISPTAAIGKLVDTLTLTPIHQGLKFKAQFSNEHETIILDIDLEVDITQNKDAQPERIKSKLLLQKIEYKFSDSETQGNREHSLEQLYDQFSASTYLSVPALLRTLLQGIPNFESEILTMSSEALQPDQNGVHLIVDEISTTSKGKINNLYSQVLLTSTSEEQPYNLMLPAISTFPKWKLDFLQDLGINGPPHQFEFVTILVNENHEASTVYFSRYDSKLFSRTIKHTTERSSVEDIITIFFSDKLVINLEKVSFDVFFVALDDGMLYSIQNGQFELLAIDYTTFAKSQLCRDVTSEWLNQNNVTDINELYLLELYLSKQSFITSPQRIFNVKDNLFILYDPKIKSIIRLPAHAVHEHSEIILFKKTSTENQNQRRIIAFIHDSKSKVIFRHSVPQVTNNKKDPMLPHSRIVFMDVRVVAPNLWSVSSLHVKKARLQIQLQVGIAQNDLPKLILNSIELNNSVAIADMEERLRFLSRDLYLTQMIDQVAPILLISHQRGASIYTRLISFDENVDTSSHKRLFNAAAASCYLEFEGKYNQKDFTCLSLNHIPGRYQSLPGALTQVSSLLFDRQKKQILALEVSSGATPVLVSKVVLASNVLQAQSRPLSGERWALAFMTKEQTNVINHVSYTAFAQAGFEEIWLIPLHAQATFNLSHLCTNPICPSVTVLPITQQNEKADIKFLLGNSNALNRASMTSFNITDGSEYQRLQLTIGPEQPFNISLPIQTDESWFHLYAGNTSINSTLLRLPKRHNVLKSIEPNEIRAAYYLLYNQLTGDAANHWKKIKNKIRRYDPDIIQTTDSELKENLLGKLNRIIHKTPKLNRILAKQINQADISESEIPHLELKRKVIDTLKTLSNDEIITYHHVISQILKQVATRIMGRNNERNINLLYQQIGLDNFQEPHDHDYRSKRDIHQSNGSPFLVEIDDLSRIKNEKTDNGTGGDLRIRHMDSDEKRPLKGDDAVISMPSAERSIKQQADTDAIASHPINKPLLIGFSLFFSLHQNSYIPLLMATLNELVPLLYNANQSSVSTPEEISNISLIAITNSSDDHSQKSDSSTENRDIQSRIADEARRLYRNTIRNPISDSANKKTTTNLGERSITVVQTIRCNTHIATAVADCIYFQELKNSSPMGSNEANEKGGELSKSALKAQKGAIAGTVTRLQQNPHTCEKGANENATIISESISTFTLPPTNGLEGDQIKSAPACRHQVKVITDGFTNQAKVKIDKEDKSQEQFSRHNRHQQKNANGQLLLSIEEREKLKAAGISSSSPKLKELNNKIDSNLKLFHDLASEREQRQTRALGVKIHPTYELPDFVTNSLSAAFQLASSHKICNNTKLFIEAGETYSQQFTVYSEIDKLFTLQGVLQKQVAFEQLSQNKQLVAMICLYVKRKENSRQSEQGDAVTNIDDDISADLMTQTIAQASRFEWSDELISTIASVVDGVAFKKELSSKEQFVEKIAMLLKPLQINMNQYELYYLCKACFMVLALSSVTGGHEKSEDSELTQNEINQEKVRKTILFQLFFPYIQFIAHLYHTENPPITIELIQQLAESIERLEECALNVTQYIFDYCIKIIPHEEDFFQQAADYSDDEDNISKMEAFTKCLQDWVIGHLSYTLNRADLLAKRGCLDESFDDFKKRLFENLDKGLRAPGRQFYSSAQIEHYTIESKSVWDLMIEELSLPSYLFQTVQEETMGTKSLSIEQLANMDLKTIKQFEKTNPFADPSIISKPKRFMKESVIKVREELEELRISPLR